MKHRIAQALSDDGTNLVVRSGAGEVDVRIMYRRRAMRLRMDPETAARLGAELLLAATPSEPRLPAAEQPAAVA